MAFVINTTDQVQVLEFPTGYTLAIKSKNRERLNCQELGVPKLMSENSSQFKILRESCYMITGKKTRVNSSPVTMVNTTPYKVIIDIYFRDVLMYGVILKPMETIINQGQYATKVGFREMTRDMFLEKFGRTTIVKQRKFARSIFVRGKHIYPADSTDVWLLMNKQGVIKVATCNKNEICNIQSHNSEERYTVLQTTFDIAFQLMKQQKYTTPKASLYDKADVIVMRD